MTNPAETSQHDPANHTDESGSRFLFVESKDLRPGRIYWLVLSLVVVWILSVAVLTVMQAQNRHKTYQKLSQAKQQFDVLKDEEYQLMLEQQTFSSMPMVADRAVGELHMHYPNKNSRISITVDENTLAPADAAND